MTPEEVKKDFGTRSSNTEADNLREALELNQTLKNTVECQVHKKNEVLN
jgi:hypothetical protein